jgi:Inner membrane component domain
MTRQSSVEEDDDDRDLSAEDADSSVATDESDEDSIAVTVGNPGTTPVADYVLPSALVSPGSIDSAASTETVRPPPPSQQQSHRTPRAVNVPADAHTAQVGSAAAGTSVSAAAAGRTSRSTSPFLRRQPSAASTLHQHPQQQHPRQRHPHQRPPSINTQHPAASSSAIATAAALSPPPPSHSTRRDSEDESTLRRRGNSQKLRAPLKRLTSYSHNEPAYSSDDDSDSAAEADMEAVQAELERNWEGHAGNVAASTAVSRPRKRPSSRQKGGPVRYDDDIYDTGTTRRHPTSQMSFYPPESDGEENSDEDDGRPLSRLHSRAHRSHHDEEDTSSDTPDSEASFTLKDRQDAINITHPFGLKIWKPALYKKSRSVQRTAEGEIHSLPGQWPDRKIRIGNILWTLLFGWWLSLVATALALVVLILTWWSGGSPYAFVLFGLARYVFYPFGRFVELTPDEAYAEEDQGEGRSISEYQRYGALDLERGRQLGIINTSPRSDRRRGLIGRQRGHSMGSWGDYSERDSLLAGRPDREEEPNEDVGAGRKRRLFGRGEWSLGRIAYFLGYYVVVGISRFVNTHE